MSQAPDSADHQPPRHAFWLGGKVISLLRGARSRAVELYKRGRGYPLGSGSHDGSDDDMRNGESNFKSNNSKPNDTRTSANTSTPELPRTPPPSSRNLQRRESFASVGEDVFESPLSQRRASRMCSDRSLEEMEEKRKEYGDLVDFSDRSESQYILFPSLSGEVLECILRYCAYLAASERRSEERERVAQGLPPALPLHRPEIPEHCLLDVLLGSVFLDIPDLVDHAFHCLSSRVHSLTKEELFRLPDPILADLVSRLNILQLCVSESLMPELLGQHTLKQWKVFWDAQVRGHGINDMEIAWTNPNKWRVDDYTWYRNAFQTNFLHYLLQKLEATKPKTPTRRTRLRGIYEFTEACGSHIYALRIDSVNEMLTVGDESGAEVVRSGSIDRPRGGSPNGAHKRATTLNPALATTSTGVVKPPPSLPRLCASFLTCLQRLEITQGRYEAISDSTCTLLLPILQANPGLCHLSMKAHSMDLQRLLAYLPSLNNLTSLTLVGELTFSSRVALFEAIPKFPSVSDWELRDCTGSSSRDALHLLSVLKARPTVTSLCLTLPLSRCEKDASAILDSLLKKHSSALKTLDVQHCNLNDGIGPIVRRLNGPATHVSHLTRLDLSKNVVSLAHAHQLAEVLVSPSCVLRELRLKSCLIDGPSAIVIALALDPTCSPRSQTARGRAFSVNGVFQSISKRLPLSTLGLSRLWRRRDPDVPATPNTFDHNQVSVDQGATGLRNVDETTESGVHTTVEREDDKSSSSEAIQGASNTLTLLDISGNVIEGSAFEQVAMSLSRNRSLLHVDVSCSHFRRKQCAQSFLRALWGNTTLLQVDMRDNGIGKEEEDLLLQRAATMGFGPMFELLLR